MPNIIGAATPSQRLKEKEYKYFTGDQTGSGPNQSILSEKQSSSAGKCPSPSASPSILPLHTGCEGIISPVRSLPLPSKSRRPLRKSVSQKSERDLQAGTLDALNVAPRETLSTVAPRNVHAHASKEDEINLGSASQNSPNSEVPKMTADRCDRIALRRHSGERSLDTWHPVLTPIRVISDIEPSLSRAGVEYRGAIQAAGEAREMMSQGQAKVRDRYVCERTTWALSLCKTRNNSLYRHVAHVMFECDATAIWFHLFSFAVDKPWSIEVK